jgi:hypothetical protein
MQTVTQYKYDDIIESALVSSDESNFFKSISFQIWQQLQHQPLDLAFCGCYKLYGRTIDLGNKKYT